MEEKEVSLPQQPPSYVYISLAKDGALCPFPILHAGTLSVVNLHTFCVHLSSLCQFMGMSSMAVSGKHFFLFVIHHL